MSVFPQNNKLSFITKGCIFANLIKRFMTVKEKDKFYR